MAKQMVMSLAKKGLNYGAKQIIKRTGGGNKSNAVNVPGQVNINTTTINTQTITENFAWTLVPSFTPNTTFNCNMFQAPGNIIPNQGITWSPLLLSSAAKYREFRVKRCVLKLSGGASTTVSGQVLFAASKDPTVAFPSTSEFSFMEKSAKCNIATPGTFEPVFDREWHPIKDVVQTDADSKLFTAGSMFIVFAVPAAGAEALKLDIEWAFEFRGRDPYFSVNQNDTTLMLTESAGVVAPAQSIPSRYPLQRNLTTATRTYQLPTGAVRVTSIRINKRTSGTSDIIIRNAAGTDVTAFRTVARAGCWASGAATYFNCLYRNTLGGAEVTARGNSATDVVTIEINFLWVAENDTLELVNDTDVGATFAACKLCSLNITKISPSEFRAAVVDLANGVVPTALGNLPMY